MNEHEKIISRFLFTDLAIKNLELDRQHLHNSPCKIKEPYIDAMDTLISTAIKERKRLKQLMSHHKLQVEMTESDRLFTAYKYYINGYVHERTFFNPMIKKYVEGVMRELFAKNKMLKQSSQQANKQGSNK